MSGQNGLDGLSPRQRQTLEGLLSGQSQKQIARRLKISTSTVHKYVDGLHLHFRVSTNGELMAMLLASPGHSGARA